MDNLVSKIKYGFTLAEVLITLVIIGVVAAMTIPTMINNTKKQEYVSALKKTYSALSQATNRIIAEDGSVSNWLNSVDDVYERYKKYLSVTKDCGSGTGCFPQKNGTGTYKTLDNQNYAHDWDTDTGTRKIVLSDGVQIFFEKYTYAGCTGPEDNCARILVDITGAKGPNVWGRDCFEFRLKNDGLYPAGCDMNLSSSDGTKYTCKVLRENAMNY